MSTMKEKKKNSTTMNKTKVLFIVPSFSFGGTTTALASLLNSGMTKHYDIDVFQICRRDYNLQPLVSHDIGLNGLTTAYYGNFSRFHIKEKFKYLLIKILKRNHRIITKLEEWVTKETINKIERHKQYDVVVGFQEGLATRFASHFSCPRKIAWIHCDYANAYGEEVNELDLYNVFEKVVCVSHFTRQGFVERYPTLSEKTIAIHNVFDSKRIADLSQKVTDDPRFDTSRFTIISLGRIHEVKRFYLIPEIASQLKESGIDFHWYILGSADIPDELLRLTDAIKKHGLEENVIYLGGKANPYPYLKAANLLVCISKSEACPMIFNEAKILHVPIVSADFGSAFEFIEDGKIGIITSLEGISEAIMRLFNDEGLRKLIKRNISQFKFDGTELMKQIENLFC